jgi:predicted dinucleotide-binding enzyme
LAIEERRAIFIAGDDAEAKKTVTRLIEEIGFAAVDTGDLRYGGAAQQPETAIYNRNLTGREAQAFMGSEGGY